jgi:carboxylate-amine ligase
MRSIGVEEELLLVDAASGEPRSVAAEVLEAAASRGERDTAPTSDVGGSVDHELQRQQVETDTPPERELGALEADLRAWRERVRLSALEAGVRVLASGTSPLAGPVSRIRRPRYDRMAQRFGLTLDEQLVCGCHVHVGVESDDEAVRVLDRLGRWLPVLLALSANSPWWNGRETGYASYRAQVMTRWPTSGPTPHFGSVAAYRRGGDDVVGTGVALDEGMLYADARASAQHPTVEVRVADVCLDVRDTVLVAALVRSLVDTAAADRADDASCSRDLVRLATWRSSRYGLDGELLDPATMRPRPAAQVVDALLEHVDGALGESGDRARVHSGVAGLLDRGTGASRQRALLEGDPAEAVTALARITAGEA